MSSIVFLIFFGTLFAVFEDATAGEYCVTRTSVVYCVWGCCGSYPNTECCSVGTGVIVGLVASSLVAVGAVVTGLVICVYLCRQKQAKSQRVLQGPEWTTSGFFASASGPAASGAGAMYRSGSVSALTTPRSLFHTEGAALYRTDSASVLATPRSMLHTEGPFPDEVWYEPDAIPIQPPAYQESDPSPRESGPPVQPPPAYSTTPDHQQPDASSVPADSAVSRGGA